MPILLVQSGSDLPSVGKEETGDYLAALDKHGKFHKVSSVGEPELAYGEKLFDNRVSLFSSMINFLKNDCGPGGL